MKKSHQLINQDSGNTEYYTPMRIVEAARDTLGRIDLDPASSARANKRIKAAFYYSRDGLTKDWYGMVWMNHPFARDENAKWIAKLIESYEHGEVHAACCITYAATSERWFHPLFTYPQCYLYPRTNYYMPDGSMKRGVTKGSVVTYLGPLVTDFALAFAPLGALTQPLLP